MDLGGYCIKTKKWTGEFCFCQSGSSDLLRIALRAYQFIRIIAF